VRNEFGRRRTPNNRALGSTSVQCVSIDLEIDPKTNRILSFAGVRQKPVDSCAFKQGNLLKAFNGLDRFSDAAEFIVGHNFITFDARHLETIKRDLRLLRKPVIDTLWLNPLAFPRNPYHHLVKHYQNGRLQAGHVNDPEPPITQALTCSILSDDGHDTTIQSHTFAH
jgi:ATP-dependent DNA helicase RecQ